MTQKDLDIVLRIMCRASEAIGALHEIYQDEPAGEDYGDMIDFLWCQWREIIEARNDLSRMQHEGKEAVRWVEEFLGRGEN